MNKQQIMQIAQQDPRIQEAVGMLQQQIGDMPVTPEGLDELIEMLQFALDNPQQYPQIRSAAIADGMVDAEDMPEEFNPTVIVSMLVLLYGMRDRLGQQKNFARGGLAMAAQHLQSAGRNGDTILAHITPEEARILQRHGGSGRINPHTGLPEYGWFSKLLKIVAPIALNFIAPGLGTAIGSAIGLSGTAAAIAGNALLNAGTAALTGGDVLKGALMGGLTGGLGTAVGGAANSLLGAGLSQTAQNALGSGLIGGVSGLLTGEGFGKGALQGALGSYVGSKVGELGSGAVGAGTQAGGQTFANMMAAGYKPAEAVTGGALSGLATSLMTPKTNNTPGLKMKPSDAVVEGLKPTFSKDSVVSDPASQYSLSNVPNYSGNVNVDYSLTGQTPAKLSLGESSASLDGSALAPKSPAGTDYTGKIMNAVTNASPMQIAAGVATLGSLGSAPQPVQQAVQQMSPEKQEYFNRPSVVWDWDAMQNDANAANQDLGTYMAQNWGQITSGKYNKPAMAQGGMLSPLARFAQGSGSGRADTIDAKLSDGEYVLDAETVAMLGDGSSKEGARRLEEMRQKIRKHKGKIMAKGKFSPNAKSPLAYIKGAV